MLKTFKRLAALTTDDATIADALSLSPALLEVSADRTSVKRRIPIPEDLNLDQRSIYAVRTRRGQRCAVSTFCVLTPPPCRGGHTEGLPAHDDADGARDLLQDPGERPVRPHAPLPEQQEGVQGAALRWARHPYTTPALTALILRAGHRARCLSSSRPWTRRRPL